jgi:predicted metal-dependent hydrolase
MRYAPERELPPYTYVPGRAPHPVNDPRGHSFGMHPAPASPPDPDDARSCPEFLWGVDLFNHGYYWEAHEAWEAVWIAAGRTTPEARFVQALIKLAAAGVKAREGRPEGVRRHAARARELLAEVRTSLGHDAVGFLNLAFDEVLALCGEMQTVSEPRPPKDAAVRPLTLTQLVLRTE